MRRLRILIALAAFCSVPLHAAADMPLGAVGGAGDAYAGAAARTVRAIVEYTRWPQAGSDLVLCIAGPVSHAGQLGNWRTSSGQQVVRRNIAAQTAATAGCEILYMGNLSVPVMRQLTAAVRGKGVLTIAENDPNNASEAMFVLTYKPNSLSFRLNIDAVSRSGLKVDPRVLRIAQGGG